MEVKLLFFLLLVVAVMGEARGRRPSRKRMRQNEHYHRIMAHNMEDKSIRQLPPSVADPEGNDQPINVTLDFTLSAVTELNKKKGYAELEGFFTTSFVDPRLRGHQGEDVQTLRLNPKDIWTPDIDLFNSVHPGMQIIELRPTAIIRASGDVSIVNKVRTRTVCDVIGQLSESGDVNCTLKFGSWAYNGLEIYPRTNASPSGILSTYKLTSVWNVTAANAFDAFEYFSCCPEPYPSVQFSFLMKKRSRS